MVDKKEPASGWPIVKGEYDAGDPKSCVVVATMGSHFNQFPIKAGAGMAGPCKTENLGIEKIVANIISNPNIRFLIICGSEVKGHISGDALECLHKHGLKDGRIVNAKGAIPFIENLDDAAVKRFQEQVQTIYMIDVEDEAKITAAIQDCIAKDPGAFPADPMTLSIKEKEVEEEEGGEVVAGAAVAGGAGGGELMMIQSRLRTIKTDIKGIGYLNKFTMGWYAGKMEGVMLGIIISIVLLALLFPGGIDITALRFK
ncbi:tetrahydromethanopterin S-methyltransferase subunit A [Methanocella sp. CWC-04]|uniref:Tetrahydromethanopterin S-methyltransferase subunit A n=1 Tax=Methanooceanicella nereidis TaxID=2052831 RepID=A0AAP2REJ7_9EURY|nr:tetrahydromethanopterin S-methyltransferase subunit A [Methanocella sp. CWC-04]MCD1296191.1 tetrahydromethanopterin S-methyltransferase subunit A [Methanocella sp. CWC-04]